MKVVTSMLASAVSLQKKGDQNTTVQCDQCGETINSGSLKRHKYLKHCLVFKIILPIFLCVNMWVQNGNFRLMLFMDIVSRLLVLLYCIVLSPPPRLVWL